MRAFYLLVLLAFSTNVFAQQNVLSGLITDSLHNPLPGADVYFPDLKRGAVSNQQGRYSIAGITSGTHLAEVSHVGYSTVSSYVQVNGATTANFVLLHQVVEQSAVVVTGVSRATRLRSMPFSVNVLSGNALAAIPATNLVERVATLPGVSSTTTGPAISKPVIRGMGYNRVVTLSDGMKQEGQQWGDEHGLEIDEFSVNKIEVLKGPASLIYGSDAMGGVINILQNVPAPVNTLQLSTGAGYNTNNKQRYVFANTAGNTGAFNWRLFGSAKAAQDFQNKYDGHVLNSRYREKNLGGYAGFNGSWGFSHLIFNTYENTPGIVEGARDSLGNFLQPAGTGEEVPGTAADYKATKPAIPYQQINHNKLLLDNHFNIGRQHLSVNAGWQQNKRAEYGDATDPGVRELFFDLNTITYNARLDFDPLGGWKPSIGFNGMSQKNRNGGEEQIIPDYNSNEAGVFVYTQKEFEHVTISGGARYDAKWLDAHNLMEGEEIKGQGFSRTFRNFSGSAGLAWQATPGLTVKANVARSFRAPVASELASNGLHEGTNRYEYGARDLKSETGFQNDLSVEFSNEHLTFSAAGYLNYFHNYIFYNKLVGANNTDSLLEVDGEYVTAFQYAQTNASIKGAEFTLDLHPHPVHWLHFENSLSFLAGRFKEVQDGSYNLPYMPAPKWTTELRADAGTIGKLFSGAFASVELENTFAQKHAFTGYNTETETPGYRLLHATIGANFVNRHNKVLATVSIAGQNLTNTAYQSHLSRLKYADENLVTGRRGVYNMGRNFNLRLAFPLSWNLKQPAR